jgi:[ribosomal protein S5]-alanine N-acetyltransferase
LIGSVGLNPFLRDEGIPEIEWAISPEYWGKGYATEIGRAMLAYGFEETSFPAIMGFAIPSHKASRRVKEKIGMTYLHDREDQGKMLSFYRVERRPIAT